MGRKLTSMSPLGGVTRYRGQRGGRSAERHRSTRTQDGIRIRRQPKLTSRTDPLGQKTTYLYNGDNELEEDDEGGRHVDREAYDANGNVSAITDANGHKTTNAYDHLSRLVKVTRPLNQSRHTPTTRPATPQPRPTRPGVYDDLLYDAADQLTKVDYSQASTADTTYTYDLDGRRTQMTDGTGTTASSYDSLGRLTSTTNGAGATVGYAYDLAGRATALTYPNGKVVKRKYDPAGNFVSVTDWAGRTTTFGYDKNSNVTSEAFESLPTVVDTFTYDAADNVTGGASKRDHAPGVQLHAERRRHGREHDAVRRRAPVVHLRHGQPTRIRLAGLVCATDDAGDPTQTPSVQPLVYDSANRLTTSGVAPNQTTYGYDVNGNRISTTPPWRGSPCISTTRPTG